MTSSDDVERDLSRTLFDLEISGIEHTPRPINSEWILGRDLPTSPRLPQEILDLIVGHIGTVDLRTLQACSLSGSPLCARAQRAMFTDISLHIGNINSMNDCLTSTSFSEYARTLAINAIEIVSTSDIVMLQNDVALLATCRRLGPEVRLEDISQATPTPSLISSLHISMLCVSSLTELLRIILAFPQLSDLSLVGVRWRTTGDHNTNPLGHCVRAADLVSRMPRLMRLSIRFGRPAEIVEALFPPASDVHLQSIELDHFNMSSLCWPRLVERAGAQLQELTLRPLYGEFTQIDLKANSSLRILRLYGVTIYSSPELEVNTSYMGSESSAIEDPEFWLLSLLRTVKSCALEEIVFKDVRVVWKHETRRLVRTLDALLSSEDTFKNVKIVDFHPASNDGRGLRSFKRLANQWMPNLSRRGLLFLEGVRFG